MAVQYGGGTMKRRTLREHCFKLLFCTDFYTKEEEVEQINAYMEQIEEEEYNENGEREVLHSVNLNEDAQWELKERVDKILGMLSTIDEELEKVTKGWKLNRIGKVELTILRLACYEIKYDREVPTAVAINEAVELSKKYGGEESASFVNGILAKLVE